jgi:hypothetical protein
MTCLAVWRPGCGKFLSVGKSTSGLSARSDRSAIAPEIDFGLRAELTAIGHEPDVTLGVADDLRHERMSVSQGNLDWLEKCVPIDRADTADKNAAAAFGCLRRQETIAHRKFRTVAQDQPAVAGLHDVLDFD